MKEVVTKLLKGKARPKMIVECSSISLEGSAELRELLIKENIQYLAAPVSGNAKVIKAGKLTFVCSGPKKAFDAARPLLDMIAVNSSYVGEGELARIEEEVVLTPNGAKVISLYPAQELPVANAY